MRVLGRPADLSQPRSALASGIGFVPDDRKRAALLPTRSVAENFSVAWTSQLTRAGLLDTRSERRRVRAAIERYNVVTASPQSRITRCRAATSRRSSWGVSSPATLEVLVLSEPTRGIDVGAKTRDLPADAGARGAGRRDRSSSRPSSRSCSGSPIASSSSSAARCAASSPPRGSRRRRWPTSRSPACLWGARLDDPAQAPAGPPCRSRSRLWSWSAPTSRSPRTCS